MQALEIHDLIEKKSAKTKLKQAIVESFDNECAYCGEENPTTIDHVKSKWKGGDSRLSNLVACCEACNQSKSSYEVFEWYRKRDSYSIHREQKLKDWIEGISSGDTHKKLMANL
jgi:5-methylcytosine-specific restriction endonuclease McrA